MCRANILLGARLSNSSKKMYLSVVECGRLKSVIPWLHMFVMIIFFLFQIYITQSYDATTHFESTCNDVVKVFDQANGAPFDASKVKTVAEDEWDQSASLPLQGTFLDVENLG